MKKILMIIVLVLSFVTCDDYAKYQMFADKSPADNYILTAEDLVYKNFIGGWVTEDGENLIEMMPFQPGSF